MLGALVASALGAPAADLITSLPGWTGPLPSKQYSGFVNSTKDAKYGQLHTHYWFAESESDPANDPVLVWFNGGPGASSLFGFMVELGPFTFNDDSKRTPSYNATGIPSPIANPYGWTKVASLLAISGPPPVGFSYCDAGGVSGDGYSCGDWDDTRTAIANKDALVSWATAFPEFAARDMYIAGESYAGIYVPTLVEQMLADAHSGLHLKGFAIGDGCIGHQDMPAANYLDFHVEFFHGHGQFSDKTFRRVQAACGAPSRGRWTETTDADGGTVLHVGFGCAAALALMTAEIGGYYSYNLYDECWYENDIGRRLAADDERTPTTPAPLRPASLYDVPPLVHIDAAAATVTVPRSERARLGKAARAAAVGSRAADAHAPLGGALNDYVCGGPPVQVEYLNISDVKKALHVPTDAFFFQCDNGAGFNYHGNTKALMPFYRHVIEQTDLRVLVYNGDADPGLNSFYAQNWTAALGYAEVQSWRPWTLDGKQAVGGYVTRYEHDFDFLTIRGAGHMVPEYQARTSLEFLRRWLKNEDFQKYARFRERRRA